MNRLPLLFVVLSLVASAISQPLTVTILHTNDLHGRVEPFRMGQGVYGGYARHVTLIRQFREKDPNVLLLSGGDTFQGTLYFTVYEGLADLFFMNLKRYDAMVAGNHEFDLGPEPLVRFAQGAHFPIVATNLEITHDDLRERIARRTVLEVGGQRIGILGATTPDLHEISSPGDEVRILELEEILQNEVDGMKAQGIDKIILLSHLGYDLEKRVAAKVRGIDVIVGGHSHSLLGEFDNPDFPPSEGPYPTVVEHPDGERTLVLQAWEWGKLLGRIKIDFDERGRIARWHDAQPIVVDASVEEDPMAKSAVVAMRKPIEDLRRSVVATSPVALDGSRETVRRRESPMGNVIADAMLAAGKEAGAEIALMNGGGIRAGLPEGVITYESAIAVHPFGNTIVFLDLRGAEIYAAFEHAVSGIEAGEGRFLHPSRGFRYTFDARRPVGRRIQSATLHGVPIDRERTYRVVVNHFMAGGGDGFTVFKESKGRRIESGMLDLDVLVNYLKTSPELSGEPEGRIVRIDD
jgi:5'-nucleotidase / UDP-sugar diphosphatase